MALDIFVIGHKACLITRPPLSDKSNDLTHGQQEVGIVSKTARRCSLKGECMARLQARTDQMSAGETVRTMYGKDPYKTLLKA